MKRLLFSISFSAFALSLPAFAAEEVKPAPASPAAPGPQTGAQMIERRLTMMKETLNLTPEQVEKIRPMMAKDGEKLKAIIDDTTLTAEDRRAKVREVMKASGEEISAVLTPEQTAKWKEEAEKRRAEMQKRREQSGNQ